MSALYFVSLFFFQCYGDHRDLHSFPTRRSSDLSRSRPRNAAADSRSTSQGSAGPKKLQIHLGTRDRKSTRLNSSHQIISYAVFCLKKKKTHVQQSPVTVLEPQAVVHRCAVHDCG